MENSNEALVLTPTEARKLLGNCSKGVFYDAIRRGIVPSIRLGPRKIIIPRQRFLEWLNGGNNLYPQE